jgi:hypothetical protein
MDETAIDLLTQMVCLEPAKRISAKEALRHPYFSEYYQNINGGCSENIEID